MSKLKQKLKRLFSFLWNEFPKRHSSKALFIYTIITSIIIWWPFVLCHLFLAVGGYDSGTGLDGVALLLICNLMSSFVFNIIFGIVFYILIYRENKNENFRLKTPALNKFYKTLLILSFFIFNFSFLVSIFFVICAIINGAYDEIFHSVYVTICSIGEIPSAIYLILKTILAHFL